MVKVIASVKMIIMCICAFLYLIHESQKDGVNSYNSNDIHFNNV